MAAVKNLMVRCGADFSGLTRATKVASKSMATMQKASGALKSAMSRIASVVSLAAIVSFGKSCIEAASDLQEVQNVVDVTFGEMSEDVNGFARNAITQFGLSETAAKRYTGTMGAMLKSMGLTTEASAQMAMNITGLAGDMASFYNLKAEDAFTKIRSGISGETEPLKQLGINMSIVNLESYAMARGINKSYKSMTQAEQAVLRYNYLLEVTSDAQGDFSRTSSSWANQTRILSERFNQLKTAIGQGLIQALTPALQVLNQLMATLVSLANTFSTVTASVFGKQTAIASGAIEAAEGQEQLAQGIGSATKAAKKSLAGFDELTRLQDPSGGGGGGGSVGGTLDMEIDSPASKDDTQATDENIAGITTMLQKMSDAVKSGDWTELGETIGVSFNSLWEKIDWPAAGQALSDGIRNAFAVAKSAIQTIDWDGIGSDIAEAISSIDVGGATAAAIETVTELLDGLLDTCNSYIQNTDWNEVGYELYWTIKDALDNVDWDGLVSGIFELLGSALGAAMGFAGGSFDGVWSAWQESFQNYFDNYFAPHLNETGKLSFEGFLSGMGDTIVGEISGIGTWLEQNIGNPFIQGFEATFGISQEDGRLTQEGAQMAYSIQSGIESGWEDVTQFFSTAWDDVKNFFTGIPGWFETNVTGPVASFFSGLWDGLSQGATDAWDGVQEAFGAVSTWFDESVIQPVGGFFTGLWDGLSQGATDAWNGVQEAFGSVSTWFEGIFSDAWERVVGVFSPLGDTFADIKDSVLEGFKTVVNNLIDGLNQAIAVPFNGINQALRSIRDINIMGLTPFSGLKTIAVPQIPKLADGAVIQPGHEFLAILGDQTSGVNIEAPLATIEQAVANVMGDFEESNIAGHETTASLLRDILEAVLSISIGDDMIFAANTRYQEKLAVMTGGWG